MQTDFDVYCPSGFVDSFEASENIKEGDWTVEWQNIYLDWRGL